MKNLLIIILFFVVTFAVTFVFCFSSLAGVDYFNSDSEQISWADHKEIAMNWQKEVRSGIMDRVDTFLYGGEYGSIDTDAIIVEHPEVVRQIRLEQWKRYRTSHSQ